MTDQKEKRHCPKCGTFGLDVEVREYAMSHSAPFYKCKCGWVGFSPLLEQLEKGERDFRKELDRIQDMHQHCDDQECTKGDELEELSELMVDEIDRLRADLLAEKTIVSRIWEIYGNPTYDVLRGRSIYDLIEMDRKENDTLRADLNYRMEQEQNAKMNLELALEEVKTFWLKAKELELELNSSCEYCQADEHRILRKENEELRSKLKELESRLEPCKPILTWK